jgi:hypothetical protein
MPSFIVEGAPIDIYVIGSQGPRGRDAATTVVTGNITAQFDYQYNVAANAVISDPGTPVEGKSFVVFVLDGTATVGGVTYSDEGSVIRRYYENGEWRSKLYRDSAAYATAAQGTDERVPTSAGLTDKFNTAKDSLVDGDRVAIFDSAASNAPKHSLWSVVKSTLKTYFDAIYAAMVHTHVSADITDKSSVGASVDAGKVVAYASNGALATSGNGATISTSGSSAGIFTNGDSAEIYTNGSDAGIWTNGVNASIYTRGSNSCVETRGTFKLFNGTYVTTLSHAPTANRSISFPDKNGTLAIGSGTNGNLVSEDITDATTTGEADKVVKVDEFGVVRTQGLTSTTYVRCGDVENPDGMVVLGATGVILDWARGENEYFSLLPPAVVGEYAYTAPSGTGTLALTSDITNSVTSATSSDGTADLSIASLAVSQNFSINETNLFFGESLLYDYEGDGAKNHRAALMAASETEVKSANFTAENGGTYTAVATLTVTDPTPSAGASYSCFVRNGSVTMGSDTYSVAGTQIFRVYHSGAWANYPVGAGGGGSVAVGDITGLGADVATALAIAANGVGGFVTDSGTVANAGYATIAGNATSANEVFLTGVTGLGTGVETALGIAANALGGIQTAGLGIVTEADSFTLSAATHARKWTRLTKASGTTTITLGTIASDEEFYFYRVGAGALAFSGGTVTGGSNLSSVPVNGAFGLVSRGGSNYDFV